MAYENLIRWMFNLERFGIKLGLDNMTEYLSRIGNPHQDFRSVHVAGTNGKGSVCAFLDSILRESGLKVGLYTSPHLVDFRERITVGGEMISERDVVRIGTELRETMGAMSEESGEKQLTFFEFTTGLAFRYFSEQEVDIAVVEVGMGGRLDATNLVTPEVSVITRIGLEHTTYLGSTIEDIAREKAGIIKPEVPVVCSDRNPASLRVIKAVCDRKSAALMLVGRDFDFHSLKVDRKGTSFDYEGKTSIVGLSTNLIGKHQAENAATAIAVAEILMKRECSISEEHVRRGVSHTCWPGRLQIWSDDPLLILDGSHNPEGVRTTVSVLESLGLLPLAFIIACMNDKDAKGMIEALAPHSSRLIITEVAVARSMRKSDLEAVARQLYAGSIGVEDSVSKALEGAQRSPSEEGTCIIGSFYLIGEALRWLGSRGQDEEAKDYSRKV